MEGRVGDDVAVPKISVDLDDVQMLGLERITELTGRSRADLIRDGVDQIIQDHLTKRLKMKARFHNAAAVGEIEDLLKGLGESG